MSKTAFTISELARQENIGRTRIYELISEGKLRARKHGRNTLVLSKDWEEYLENLPDAVGSGAIRPAPHKKAA